MPRVVADVVYASSSGLLAGVVYASSGGLLAGVGHASSGGMQMWFMPRVAVFWQGQLGLKWQFRLGMRWLQIYSASIYSHEPYVLLMAMYM